MKLKETTNKKGVYSSAQLRQKVIYYQSEAAKYKFLSEKYEWLISEALQSTTIRNNETEEKNLQEKPDSISYFNYSLIQDEQNNPYIYGSYIIKNIGTVPLDFPIVCLKVNDPNSISIGGKIGEVNGGSDKLISFEEWTYVHEEWKTKWKQQGELWLRPKQTKTLLPDEKLTFSGFDITFKNSEPIKQVLVEGFFYSQKIITGIKSLNSISISL